MGRFARLMIVVALVLTGWPGLAWTQGSEPPQTAFLRIDPGFHTQIVNRIASDAAGRLLATVSDDKSIRIWSVADGSLLSTLRVPIADGEEGELYAVALSPDGKTLLAGGNTGYAWDRNFSIYLFDVGQNRMRGRLGGLPAPVNQIAYSPDGTRFAVAFGGRAGIRLYDAGNGRALAEDAAWQDRATGLAFDVSGRFAATGFDGQVRLYERDGRKLAQQKTGPGKPFSLAFSPDGRRIAVGFSDQARVDLFDAQTLRPAGALNAGGGGNLAAVAFLRDGRLAAGGSLARGDGWRALKLWPASLQGGAAEWPVSRDTIADLRSLPDGTLAVASADPVLTRLDSQGNRLFRKAGSGLDFRDVIDRRFVVSQDGMSVEFRPAEAQQAWRFNLPQRSLSASAANQPFPAAPPATLQPVNWRNRPDPYLAGRRLFLDPEELARSFTATPDRRFLVLGTDWHLIAYSAQGERISRLRLPAPAWAVASSGDGRTIVAAIGDGTLRWFGLDAGGQLTERVAVFPVGDGQRWIAWTPEGVFDHAEFGGKELVGFLVNRARNQQPEWVSFAQLYRIFYAPDIVQRRAAGGSDAEARARLAEIGNLATRLTAGGPPKVELAELCWQSGGRPACLPLPNSETTRSLSIVAAPAAPTPAPAPEAALTFTTATTAEIQLPEDAQRVEVRYKVLDQGGGVGPVDLFLDSRNVGRSRGDASRASELRAQAVPASPGVMRLQVRAYDKAGKLYGQSRQFTVAMPQPRTVASPAAPVAGAPAQTAARPAVPDDDPRPRLFMLIAGADKYRGEVSPLNFAVADARAFGNAIKAGAGNLWREKKIIELYDADATTPRIIKAMDEIAAVADKKDVVLIYIAGHGIVVDQRYYFLPVTVTAADEKTIQTYGFSEILLMEGLTRIKAANAMVFLDTCHAGAFTLDSAAQLSHESGLYVLAGATSVEEALDSYDNRNGVFATALLRGLAGDAALRTQKSVNNLALGAFAKETVPILAAEKRHKQSARFHTKADLQPFPLVELKP